MDTIGKYKLVRVIGEGGMGQVYEAIDPMIGRRVAIKTISLNVATDVETRSRFFREAQAAGQLSHPNLITIHDIGDQDGTPYIVMEFLDGMDLNRKIRQQRLSYDHKLQIMTDVCEGLSFAHGHNIIHRDIKPANIFIITNGRAKILDFGLARGALSDVTQTGKIVGTPHYMSPEQIRGEDVDHRADIFATGVVFYELLSGRKAFEGDSLATTLYKVLETHPQPVHLLDDRLPATLSAVIERALSKDRLARYQTSGEMLDALLQAHGRTTQLERTNLQTMPIHLRGTAAPPARRSAATMLAWAIAGLAVAASVGLVLMRQRPQPAPTLPPSVVQPVPDSRPAATAPIAVPEPPPAPPSPRTAPSSPPDNKTAKAAVPRPQGAIRPAEPAPTAAIPQPAAPPAPETKITPAPPPIQAPPAAPEPKPAAVAPPPATAPAPVVPPPPPAVSPAHAEENPVTAIQAVLARYRAALESRDIGGLKRIWPALSGRQEDALRNEFEHSQAIVADLDGVDIRPTGNTASVTCRRSYAVTTADGRTLKTATKMFMTLSRHDGVWSIDSIRHEGAR
jgi:serine/threonine protein kinase